MALLLTKPRDYEIKDGGDAWEAHGRQSSQVDQAIKAEDIGMAHRMGSCPGELKRVIKQKLYPQPILETDGSDHGLKVAGVMGQKDDTYQRRNRRQTCMQEGVYSRPTVMTPMSSSSWIPLVL